MSRQTMPADQLILFHDRKTELAQQLRALQGWLHSAWEESSKPGHDGRIEPPDQWQPVAQTVMFMQNLLGPAAPDTVRSTLAAIAHFADEVIHMPLVTTDQLAAQIQWAQQIEAAVHEMYTEEAPGIPHEEGSGVVAEYLYTLKQRVEDAHTSYNLAYEYCEFMLSQRYHDLNGLEQAHMGDQPLGTALGSGPDDQEITGHLFGVISHLDGLAHYLASRQLYLREDGVAALRTSGQWIRDQMLAAMTGPARQFMEPGHYHQIAHVFHEMAGIANELLANP